MIAAGGGAIVNVSSIAGIRWTGARYLPYSASKAAIIGYTRALALEYARHKIRVNCIVPGYVDSPMMRGGIAQRLGADAVADEVTRRQAACPLGRLATGWDIANAALFLASEDAAYITGVALPVDGGASLDAAL
jgi:NAD(P)-dependent dehydrogenase (short-subunit alcohol dehydrogenase family)